MILRLFVAVIVIGYVSGQECTTPDGGVGVCMHLKHCNDLQRKAKSLELNTVPSHLRASIQIELFQSRSECGIAPDTVCCGNCRTPEGVSGIVKFIRECYLFDYVRTKSVEKLRYVTASRISLDSLDVCCGPAPILPASRQTSLDCDDQITMPPDPDSTCCGVYIQDEVRIFGGNDTGIYDYPWTVILEYKKKGNMKLTCGGTLISDRFVVTAAHCIYRQLNSVRVGEYDLRHEGKDCISHPDGSQGCTDGAEVIPVHSVLIHSEYNYSTQHNDIALIRLKKQVRYTNFVRPICLPSYDSSTRRQTYQVTGWGKTSEKISRSHVKQTVDVEFMDKEACQYAYAHSDWGADYPKLWEKQLCAGGEAGKDSCDGDSGGPLMVDVNADVQRYELAGVISFGPRNCGTKGVPGVYTNVYNYLDWIHDNIRQHPQGWFIMN